MRATEQDGTYPRPMMLRPDWVDLDGEWGFAHDDQDEGLSARWFNPACVQPFNRSIRVPYPPESPASGIDDPGLHPVVWYRRVVPTGDLRPSGTSPDRRVLLHFGAVDFVARVWCSGLLVAEHVGGQTPFTADLTDALDADAEHQVIVVRAEDQPADLEQPRGKQDWRTEPHGIWYHRTTGIWQSVWAEAVPRCRITEVDWIADPAGASIAATIRVSCPPTGEFELAFEVQAGDEMLTEQSVTVNRPSMRVDLALPALRNGQDRARLLWTPEQPVLVDITVTLRERTSRRLVDRVASYTGLRSVGVSRGGFELNDQPYYLRAVLNQGYRRDTHWAAADTAQLAGEVQTIKAMGFNTVRNHQKAEDSRFLFWADRLGLMVWGETAAAYEFSPRAVEMLVTEWSALVRRDCSHPAVIAWVPVNESWGVQDIATQPVQRDYAQALASLTRALDPSRPVISNDGWEHVDSDILGLHDYTTDPAQLRTRYADRACVVDDLVVGRGAQGRRPLLTAAQLESFLAGQAPLMITEFGGVSLPTDENAWGYAEVGSDSEYAGLLEGLFGALRVSPVVTGFCYTQFMDTGQETNGLLRADGHPKLPLPVIRFIVTGIKDDSDPQPSSTFGWPQ